MTTAPMRVLVTGGAGLIGSHIVDLLMDGREQGKYGEIVILGGERLVGVGAIGKAIDGIAVRAQRTAHSVGENGVVFDNQDTKAHFRERPPVKKTGV